MNAAVMFPSKMRVVPIALAMLWVRPASAQEVLIAIRDSATGVPIAGAIATALDGTARVLTRGLTNESGRVRLSVSPAARSIRVVRLGYRLWELRFPAGEVPAELSVAMMPQPMLLDPMIVAQSPKCSRRPDREAALSLLTHARSGLLASVISRSVAPPRMVALLYRRKMDGVSNRIVQQQVKLDSTLGAASSFNASMSAREFVAGGFISGDLGGDLTYHAPDAEVLLDDAFSDGYCFHIADRDRARPNQVGLSFAAPDRRDNRIDIEGTLWVDTTALSLIDIEFRYRGLDPRFDVVNPGGRVSFSELRKGVVMVDRWSLRLPAADSAPALSDMAFSTAAISRRVDSRLRAVEVGGELARASWPDGAKWNGSLGTLSVTIAHPDLSRAAGIVLGLWNTGYRATTDESGVATFTDLLPGPYQGEVLDPRLDEIDFGIPTSMRATGVRDSLVTVSLVLHTAEDFVASECKDARRFRASDPSRLLIRVISDVTQMPVAKVQVSALYPSSTKEMPDKAVTGSQGIVALCRGFRPLTTITLIATRGGYPPISIPVDIRQGLTVVRVPWPY